MLPVSLVDFFDGELDRTAGHQAQNGQFRHDRTIGLRNEANDVPQLLVMEKVSKGLQRHELRDLEKRHAAVDLQSIIEAVGSFEKAEQGVRVGRQTMILVLPE